MCKLPNEFRTDCLTTFCPITYTFHLQSNSFKLLPKSMSQSIFPKVLGCLISVGETQIYYHVLDQKKVRNLCFTNSGKDPQRHSNTDSPAVREVNADTLKKRIWTAECDITKNHWITMTHNCSAWFLKEMNLHVALIIEGSRAYASMSVEDTLKQIASEISALFEEENDDIPLYILRIRCRSITAPIIRRFNRKSVVKFTSLQWAHSIYHLL